MIVFAFLGGLCYLVSLVCTWIVIINAFTNEVWKGLACWLCGLYWIYYALTEFDSDNKTTVLAGAIGGGIVGYLLILMSGVTAHHAF